jgi:hypothetical protein
MGLQNQDVSILQADHPPFKDHRLVSLRLILIRFNSASRPPPIQRDPSLRPHYKPLQTPISESLPTAELFEATKEG